MSDICERVHELFHRAPRHGFPFRDDEIPLNGIYMLYEKGERGHRGDRIVRVGTHTGENQLRSRLKQHFLHENKDRSIFRKNIGRALLNKRHDPFLRDWDLDLTTRKAKDKFSGDIDFEYQKKIEGEVTKCIRTNFSFAVIEIVDKTERLTIESKLISTVSWCEQCRPSVDWLGNFSTKGKIVKSGLWLVNELYKTPLNVADLVILSEKI